MKQTGTTRDPTHSAENQTADIEGNLLDDVEFTAIQSICIKFW